MTFCQVSRLYRFFTILWKILFFSFLTHYPVYWNGKSLKPWTFQRRSWVCVVHSERRKKNILSFRVVHYNNFFPTIFTHIILNKYTSVILSTHDVEKCTSFKSLVFSYICVKKLQVQVVIIHQYRKQQYFLILQNILHYWFLYFEKYLYIFNNNENHA